MRLNAGAVMRRFMLSILFDTHAFSGLRRQIDGSRLEGIHRFNLFEIHANRNAWDIGAYEALTIANFRNVQHELVYRL